MYTYNKDDKSYTFSSDDLDLEKLFNIDENNKEKDIDTEDDENNLHKKKKKKIEVINGGNDLDISPVSNYIEIEKPKNDKKENIVIPEDKK